MTSTWGKQTPLACHPTKKSNQSNSPNVCKEKGSLLSFVYKFGRVAYRHC